jgi:hypothetical protein
VLTGATQDNEVVVVKNLVKVLEALDGHCNN